MDTKYRFDIYVENVQNKTVSKTVPNETMIVNMVQLTVECVSFH